jgi:hypothetical protein
VLDNTVRHSLLPQDYICIHRSLIDNLPTLAAETLKVLLVLVDRQNQATKVGLSLNELARTADVGRIAARAALSFLAQEGYLTITPKGKRHVIVLASAWTADSVSIPFTYDDTDDSKISTLEGEVRRLAAQYQRERLGESSGLVEILRGEERDLVQEIENRRGYGISTRESFLLGKAIARYGPARVKSTWRQLQSSTDPIRAAYAMLVKGAKGKPAQQIESQPFQKVKYRDVD